MMVGMNERPTRRRPWLALTDEEKQRHLDELRRR
jgi:hypothetical protein